MITLWDNLFADDNQLRLVVPLDALRGRDSPFMEWVEFERRPFPVMPTIDAKDKSNKAVAYIQNIVFKMCEFFGFQPMRFHSVIKSKMF